MTTDEQLARVQDQRAHAFQDLRDTLAEVKAKVERTKSDLRPHHLVESHPVAASLVTGALGFMMGSRVEKRRTGPVIIAAMLGFALALRSSRAPRSLDGGKVSPLE